MSGCQTEGTTVQFTRSGYFMPFLVALLLAIACSACSEGGDATPNRFESPPKRQALGVELGIVSPGSAEPGGKAPDFVLRDLQKNPVRLSDFLGTPVVLNFFASWCAPCLEELPLIQEAHLQAEAKGFVVLGVVFQDSRGAIEALAETEHLTYPMVIDGDNSVGRAYHVIGPPYTFFIDQYGNVVSVETGAMKKEILQHQLDRLLGRQRG